MSSSSGIMGKNNVLLILAALLMLGGGGYVVYDMTRGLRNNNPGNIRYDGTQWTGLTGQDDKGFCVFSDPIYGLRAMARILSNYVTVDGVAPTPLGIATRWAPPSENDTVSYAQGLASTLGIGVNDTFVLSSALPGLLVGITKQENTLMPYSTDQLNQAIALAA